MWTIEGDAAGEQCLFDKTDFVRPVVARAMVHGGPGVVGMTIPQENPARFYREGGGREWRRFSQLEEK